MTRCAGHRPARVLNSGASLFPDIIWIRFRSPVAVFSVEIIPFPHRHRVLKFPFLVSLLLLGGLAVACKRDDPTPAKIAEAGQRQGRADLWFKENLAGAYERVGKHDPQWDGPAKVALNLMAAAAANRAGVTTDWKREVASMAQSAMDKGCTDPLVRYAALRYGIPDLDKATQTEAGAMKESAQELDASDCPPRLKLYAAERAADAMMAALPDKDQTQAELFALDMMAQSGFNHLLEALEDKTTPPAEVYEMCTTILSSRRTASPPAMPSSITSSPSAMAPWKKCSASHMNASATRNGTARCA